jgi:branched-chain amino acid transport system ATP-binding protein
MRPYDARPRGIARTFQNVALFKGMSTLDNIMTGRILKMKRQLLADLALRPGRCGRGRASRFVEEIIDFLEIQAHPQDPGRQAALRPAEARRTRPGAGDGAGALLLDEPMAGMNLEEKEDMSRFILDVNQQFGTTIALIEHDMGVVMDLSDRVVVLDYGRKIADGTPERGQVRTRRHRRLSRSSSRW